MRSLGEPAGGGQGVRPACESSRRGAPAAEAGARIVVAGEVRVRPEPGSSPGRKSRRHLHLLPADGAETMSPIRARAVAPRA